MALGISKSSPVDARAAAVKLPWSSVVFSALAAQLKAALEHQVSSLVAFW